MPLPAFDNAGMINEQRKLPELLVMQGEGEVETGEPLNEIVTSEEAAKPLPMTGTVAPAAPVPELS